MEREIMVMLCDTLGLTSQQPIKLGKDRAGDGGGSTAPFQLY
ncbi:hypothetical protein MUK42_30514 [Musa troglodytarum]|uniref:Uncharacterized protein n=1 Tax=Musa troglodytarum TaxID=320322 RepID=A0A9E7FX85_9LILI|nr:hypothetical protein MUK42_30514 [Musa troglodytarum]